MDPTIPHITLSKENNGNYDVVKYVNGYDINAVDLSKIGGDGDMTSRFISPLISEKLDKALKSYGRYDEKTWFLLKKKANPFEHGTSIFSNRAAVKLSNIDAIYSLIDDKREELYTFADIAGGPGSFSEYILYRKPKALGFGITLNEAKSESLIWYPHLLNKIKIINGKDNSGDVIKNYREFATELLKINKSGVDLAVADGAIGGNEEDPQQELVNFKLIAAELGAIVLSLKTGGKFVCKIFSADMLPMAQLIFLMSGMFEWLDISKPISSRMGNGERYLVGSGFKGQSANFMKMIRLITATEGRITHLFNIPLPSDYVTWLTNKNDIHANGQLKFSDYIGQVSKGGIVSKYNMYKAYSIWDIPSDREDQYQVVRKKQAKIGEVDNLIFKEISRYIYIEKMLADIASKLANYWDAGSLNKYNASKFMSMYLFDHLTDSAAHPHDPVLPSIKFHHPSRYYNFLRHLSDNVISEEASKKWYLSLNINDSMKNYAERLARLKPSEFAYNIRKTSARKGFVTYSNKKYSYTITTVMDNKLTSLLRPEYKSRVNEYIFLLIMRYIGTLNSGNHQLGIPDYDVISKVFNLKEELFASPMNCSITNGYHSAFPDTDKFFGSLGKFSDTNIISGYGYSVNPPYTDIVLELAMRQVVDWLTTIPNVLFYITIPVWDYDSQKQLGFDLGDKYGSYPAIEVINQSGFVKEKKIFHKDVFLYKDHNTGKFINASNTYILIVANRDLTDEEKQYIVDLDKGRESERVKAVRDLIGDKTITSYLDVGCGDAKISKEVITALDIPTYYLTDVVPINNEPSFFLTNYDNITDSYSHIPDQSLDLVTFFVSIHHISKISDLLTVIRTKLKPDGIIFIREHNVINGNVASYLEVLHEIQPDQYPSFFRSRETLTNLFQSHGFKSSKYSEYNTGINPQKLYYETFILSNSPPIPFTDSIVHPSPDLIFWMKNNQESSHKLLRKYLRTNKTSTEINDAIDTSKTIAELKTKI